MTESKSQFSKTMDWWNFCCFHVSVLCHVAAQEPEVLDIYVTHVSPVPRVLRLLHSYVTLLLQRTSPETLDYPVFLDHTFEDCADRCSSQGHTSGFLSEWNDNLSAPYPESRMSIFSEWHWGSCDHSLGVNLFPNMSWVYQIVRWVVT